MSCWLVWILENLKKKKEMETQEEIMFTIGRPSIDVIRQAFQSDWDIKGCATLSEIWDECHLLVILDSEDDMVVAQTYPLSGRSNTRCSGFFDTPLIIIPDENQINLKSLSTRCCINIEQYTECNNFNHRASQARL